MSDDELAEVLPSDAVAARDEIQRIRGNAGHAANHPDSAGYRQAHEHLSTLYQRGFPEGVSRDAVAPAFVASPDPMVRQAMGTIAEGVLAVKRAQGTLDPSAPESQKLYEAQAAAEGDPAAPPALPPWWEPWPADRAAMESQLAATLDTEVGEITAYRDLAVRYAHGHEVADPEETDKALAALYGPALEAKLLAAHQVYRTLPQPVRTLLEESGAIEDRHILMALIRASERRSA